MYGQVNKASILVDASKYIKDLKQKVERLNQDISSTGSSSYDDQDDRTPLIKVHIQLSPTVSNHY